MQKDLHNLKPAQFKWIKQKPRYVWSGPTHMEIE